MYPSMGQLGSSVEAAFIVYVAELSYANIFVAEDVAGGVICTASEQSIWILPVKTLWVLMLETVHWMVSS